MKCSINSQFCCSQGLGISNVPSLISPLVAILAIALMSVGCSTTTKVTTEQLVAMRATEWADALMEQNYDAALAMTTPGFRNSPKAERYPARYSGSSWWQSVKVHRVECDDSGISGRCEVRQIISLARPPAVNNPVPIPYDTIWLQMDGGWFVFHD